MTKLLNCPFCDGKGRHALFNRGKDKNGVAIACDVCEAQGKEFYYSYEGLSNKEVMDKYEMCKKQAANSWNTRV